MSPQIQGSSGRKGASAPVAEECQIARQFRILSCAKTHECKAAHLSSVPRPDASLSSYMQASGTFSVPICSCFDTNSRSQSKWSPKVEASFCRFPIQSVYCYSFLPQASPDPLLRGNRSTTYPDKETTAIPKDSGKGEPKQLWQAGCTVLRCTGSGSYGGPFYFVASGEDCSRD